MSHDPRCRDLADVFLSEEEYVTEVDAVDLAETIQSAVESWLGDRVCRFCGHRLATHYVPCDAPCEATPQEP